MQKKSSLDPKKTRQKIGLSVCITFLSFFIMGASGYSDYRGKIINKTPYDIKYKRVYRYLVETTNPVKERRDAPYSLNRARKEVQEFMKTANKFKYKEEDLYASLPNPSLNIKSVMTDYWQLPYETEKKGKGDCEDKAIWLYSKLLKKGFKNVRLMIGKYRSKDIIFHAWVVWYHKNRIFILDPTHQSAIKELKDFPSDYYQPFYSYYHTIKWRHHI